MIQLYFPTLPSGAMLEDVCLYMNYYFSSSSGNALSVGAYQIMSSWNEEFVTYDNIPSIDSEALSTSEWYDDMGSETDPYLVQMSITDAAKDWYYNGVANYGIAIQYESGTGIARIKSYDSGTNTCEFISITYWVFETDYYYLTNSYTGRYLHRTENIANCMQGQMGTLGASTVKWRIVNSGYGYFTIQRSDEENYYLATDSLDNGSGVRFYDLDSTTIPDNYKWLIELEYGGTILIKNKGSEYYLTASNNNSNPSSVYVTSLNSVGSDGYKMQLWRFVTDANYLELSLNMSFNNITLDIDQTEEPSVNVLPETAIWSTYKDFDYTVTSGSQFVNYNPRFQTFTGVSSGTASVTAVHKTTGISKTFNVKVNNNAIIIIPGFLGSELFIGENNPYFEEGMPLLSTEIINGMSAYKNGDTVQDLIPSDYWNFVPILFSAIDLFESWYDSMRCNDNGTSKYDIYVKEYRSSAPETRINNNCGTGDAYLDLYNELVSAYSGEYSIDLFSYDWRLSNANSAAKLDEYIDFYDYDKVILIAHSMGGYVASGYLGLGTVQREKVEQVFYLSSPLLGVPEVANIWYNEDISFVEGAISNAFNISIETFNTIYKLVTDFSNPIQNLICNYVSVYEALPSEYYFQKTGASYMSRSYTEVRIGGQTTVTECSTYSATRDVLTGCFNNFDSNLMTLAENFHDTTFISGNHVSSYVDAYYYYCVAKDENGANIANTVFHVKYYEVVSNTSYQRGLSVDGIVAGDSLVLPTSASLANAYPSKCNNVDGGHMTLVDNITEIREYISMIN